MNRNEKLCPSIGAWKSDLNQYMQLVCLCVCAIVFQAGIFFLISLHHISFFPARSFWFRSVPNDYNLLMTFNLGVLMNRQIFYVLRNFWWILRELWICVPMSISIFSLSLSATCIHSFFFSFVVAVVCVHFFLSYYCGRGKNEIQIANCQQIEFVIWFSLILHFTSVRSLFHPSRLTHTGTKWLEIRLPNHSEMPLNCMNGFHFIQFNSFC